jgi:hypothetical protein
VLAECVLVLADESPDDVGDRVVWVAGTVDDGRVIRSERAVDRLRVVGTVAREQFGLYRREQELRRGLPRRVVAGDVEEQVVARGDATETFVERGRVFASRGEVRELASDGVDVGGHGPRIGARLLETPVRRLGRRRSGRDAGLDRISYRGLRLITSDARPTTARPNMPKSRAITAFEAVRAWRASRGNDRDGSTGYRSARARGENRARRPDVVRPGNGSRSVGSQARGGRPVVGVDDGATAATTSWPAVPGRRSTVHSPMAPSTDDSLAGGWSP